MISRDYRWLEVEGIRGDRQAFTSGWAADPSVSMTQSTADTDSTELTYRVRETHSHTRKNGEMDGGSIGCNIDHLPL